MLRPREGSIHFGGKDLARVHASDMVKHGMALCPEGRRIFQQMTVLENLEMGGFTRPDKEIPGSIEQMFERRSCCTTMQSGRRIWGRNARQPGRWQKPLPGFSFASRLTLSCKYGIV